MTNRAEKPVLRKRWLLSVMLATIILLAAWITYFLISFDLNDYRQQAEKKLSGIMSLPVKIGDIHYNLHDTSLALHIANLQIGNNDRVISLEAPDLMIDLQWWGLLKRDIKFSKISLTNPQLRIKPLGIAQTINGEPRAEAVSLMSDQALLQKISIKALKILGGTVLIETSLPNQPVQEIAITELDGEFSDIRLGHLSQLTVTGELKAPGQKAKSPWQLQGRSSLEFDESNNLEPRFDLELSIKDLDLSTTKALFNEQLAKSSLEGIGDLRLHIEGSPSKGIDFQTSLTSNRITLLPSPAHTKPAAIKNLRASGQLQPHGDRPGINNLSLRVDDSHLSGRIGWTPSSQPFSATFSLFNSELSVSQIKQWLPDSHELWGTIRQNLRGQGSVQIEQAEVTFFEDAESNRNWRIGALKGELLQLGWAFEQTPAVEITSLPFAFADNLWQINSGRGQLGSIQLVFNGTGGYGKDGFVVTSLDFAGDIQPDKLLEEWHIPQHSLTTDGNIAISGHFAGVLKQLDLDLQADLSQFSINHPADLKLIPTPEDKLTLHDTLSPQKISLDHGALKWSVVKGHVSGSYLMTDPDSLSVDALMTIDNLNKLAEILPVLSKFRLHGQADLNVSQRGLPVNNHPQMTLTLRDAGMHATRHIADLSHINGRVLLTPSGLAADNLRVRLGQSSLTVQARLEDFTNPRLLLDLRAPAVRADELVFNSDKAMLRNINGHLEIDRNGLSFAPVDVHLDGGTKASVRGLISFEPPFDTQLHVTSEFARISEVIKLWTEHPEAVKEKSPLTENGKKPRATVKINAQIEHGDLYGMTFHDATGIITPSRGRLNIHPLNFSVGDGFCNVQVLSDFTPGYPTVLRISGHAEGVDALEVYGELLNQKNIVRGKLRGDFYLSGETGPNYLPSSYGNFNIQIDDGVLHEFPVLSKVFSLLNVSQIFAFQLPDMDTEGMPFDTLSANFNLDKGMLKTDDLKIQSEAMNQVYIGEFNLIDKEIDLLATIHPLGTVDKIISHIPVAGWLLTGEDKALLTASFSLKGKVGNASVMPMPLDTITNPTIGLLKRTLGLPFKLAEDPQILWGGDASAK